MASNSKEENASGISPVDALFGKEDDNSLANGFRDKVAAIHSHFDRDRDGFLNHDELRGLQIITSGNDMHQGQYVMVCNSIGCNPSNGLSVEALKLVYAAEGSNIEEDYLKVFGKSKKGVTSNKHKGSTKEEDDVLEVGEDGVDISS